MSFSASVSFHPITLSTNQMDLICELPNYIEHMIWQPGLIQAGLEFQMDLKRSARFIYFRPFPSCFAKMIFLKRRRMTIEKFTHIE